MLKDVDNNPNESNSTTEDPDNSFITLDLSDLPSRYRDVCPLGCGSRGLTFSAIDQFTLRRLAVKKVSDFSLYTLYLYFQDFNSSKTSFLLSHFTELFALEYSCMIIRLTFVFGIEILLMQYVNKIFVAFLDQD